jgi:hypothetical protein
MEVVLALMFVTSAAGSLGLYRETRRLRRERDAALRQARTNAALYFEAQAQAAHWCRLAMPRRDVRELSVWLN